MSLGDPVQTGLVFGNGPFVEVGRPTAVAVTSELIAVGGDLGWPQWNGRSVLSRSDRLAGWYPVAVYNRSDLSCRTFFTSRWDVNAVAVHPAGDMLVAGTGSYDGGYLFEGELLVHDLARGTTVSVLSTKRSVEAVTWVDHETLTFTLAPIDDEDVEDWNNLTYESFTVSQPRWKDLGPRSIDLSEWEPVTVPASERDNDGPSEALAGLASSVGRDWTVRRQAWAIAAAEDGIVLGLDGAVERWASEPPAPRWRSNLTGTCTQMIARSDSSLTLGVWENPAEAFLARPLSVLNLDTDEGAAEDLFRPGFPAVLVSRADGHLIVRDTAHGPDAGNAMRVLSPAGEVLAEVDAGSYDLFNHYFDIRRAQDFLILSGNNPKSYQDKWVTKVERNLLGRWATKRLFPLAWTPGAHLFGGPGVWTDDREGRSLIHAGAVHDSHGLLKGNAFVVRREYPSGALQWHVPLDNEVTALDECDGQVIVVTNLGELFLIDAQNGEIRTSRRVTINEFPVVPLSLAMPAKDRAWVGTLDGRAVELLLQSAP